MARFTLFSALKAALLDVDGTLLDSNDAHARSWLEVLGRHGHACDYAKVRSLIGKGGDKLLPELVGIGPGHPEFEPMSEERTALFLSRYLPGLRPTPGARQLLDKMASEGIRLVVATSAGDEMKALLDQAGVADLIQHAATSEDAENSKPDADIVHAALAKAGVVAEQALMFGDTPFDVQAARSAGVGAVCFRCGGWWKDIDLAGAIAIYDDPADLLSHWPSHRPS